MKDKDTYDKTVETVEGLEAHVEQQMLGQGALKIFMMALAARHRANIVISVDDHFYRRKGLRLAEFTPTLDRTKRIWSNIEVYEVTERTVLMSRRDPSFSPVVENIAEPGDVIIIFPGGDHKIVKPPQQGSIETRPPAPPAKAPAKK